MYRFYQDQVQRLLILTAWMKLSGIAWERAANDVQATLPRRSDGEDKTLRLVRDYFRFNQRPLAGNVIDKLEHDLTEALYQGSSEANDGTLVDKIVQIIQGPNSGNTLSGRTLERLREALLLPEEAAKFRNEIQQREMACMSCGHQLVSGELCTLGSEGMFLCGRCYPPETARCPKCKRSTPLDKRVRRAVEKGTICPECVEAVKAGVETPIVIEEPPAQAPLAPGAQPAREVGRYVQGDGGPQPPPDETPWRRHIRPSEYATAAANSRAGSALTTTDAPEEPARRPPNWAERALGYRAPQAVDEIRTISGAQWAALREQQQRTVPTPTLTVGGTTTVGTGYPLPTLTDAQRVYWEQFNRPLNRTIWVEPETGAPAAQQTVPTHVDLTPDEMARMRAAAALDRDDVHSSIIEEDM